MARVAAATARVEGREGGGGAYRSAASAGWGVADAAPPPACWCACAAAARWWTASGTARSAGSTTATGWGKRGGRWAVERGARGGDDAERGPPFRYASPDPVGGAAPPPPARPCVTASPASTPAGGNELEVARAGGSHCEEEGARARVGLPPPHPPSTLSLTGVGGGTPVGTSAAPADAAAAARSSSSAAARVRIGVCLVFFAARALCAFVGVCVSLAWSP
jgi:hypothetical protein